MIDVEDMVRKQIAVFRASDLRSDHERRAGRGKEGNLSYGPYLLISREKGAGGGAVGRLVGERMGWRVFNRTLIDAIAEKAQVRRELIESLDERDRKTIQDAVRRLFDPQPIGTDDYMIFLQEVLHTLGHQGDVVIVGRGVQFVLPSKFGLRVRLTAPVDVRIWRIARDESISTEDARIIVERTDRERTTLARRHFDKDPCDPLLHDVTINTAELSFEAAVEIVITALKAKLAVEPRVGGIKSACSAQSPG